VALYGAFHFLYVIPHRDVKIQSDLRRIEVASSSLGDELLPAIGFANLATALLEKSNRNNDYLQVAQYYAPRFADFREITRQKGIYALRGSVPKILIKSGTGIKEVPRADARNAWLTPRGDLIVLTDQGELTAFSSSDYSKEIYRFPVSNQEWSVSETIHYKYGALSEQTMTRIEEILEGWLLPDLFIDRDVFVFKVKAVEVGQNQSDLTEHFIIISSDRRTGKVDGLLLPKTIGEVPVFSFDCKRILYGGTSALRRLADQNSAVRIYGNASPEVMIGVVELESPGDPSLTQSLVSIDDARNTQWDYNIENVISRCYSVDGVDQSDEFWGKIRGEMKEITFPAFQDEVHFWRRDIPAIDPSQYFLNNIDRPKKDEFAALIKGSMPIRTQPNENKDDGAPTEAEMMQLAVDRLTSEDSDFNFKYLIESNKEILLVGQGTPKNFGISAWLFCRISSMKGRTSCIYSGSETYGDPLIISKDAKFALARGGNFTGSAFQLIDLMNLKFIPLGWSVDIQAVGLAFSPDGSQFAVLGESGTFVLAELAGGKILSRTFIDPDTFLKAGTKGDRLFRTIPIAFKNDAVIFETEGGSVVGVSKDGNDILWWSRGSAISGESERNSMVISDFDDAAFVFSGEQGRLISTKTGIWLSGRIAPDELMTKSEGCPSGADIQDRATRRISDVRFAPGGSVWIQSENCWFVREGPMPRAQLSDLLSHLEDLIGKEALSRVARQ
jgi:hypothetical protein